MRFIKGLLIKYRELISYGIVGCISALSTYFWFWFFLDLIGLHYMIANPLGWIVDVWISFILFKYLVFRSFARGTFWREAWKFISTRLVSGGLDIVLLWVLVEFFLMNERIGKVIAMVTGVVVNYLFAKLFVFKKKKEETDG